MLLEAAHKLHTSRSDFKICLAGNGNLVDQYKKDVATAGLQDVVLFQEDLSDTELNLLYNASDIVVLPSINKAEAFGLVLVEAMAAGTPVVASNLPGVRTVFEDGVSGLSFPIRASAVLSDQLRTLLDNESLCQEMSAAALERAAKFSWKRSVEQLIEAIQYEDRNHS